MRGRKIVARAALALVAVHVVVAGSVAVMHSARHLGEAAKHLGEDPAAARRRVFGAAYVATIEEIRRAIPPDGAYALIDAGTREEGAANWVRFDLAPRRALHLGTLDELRTAAKLRRRHRLGGPRLVVIAYGDYRPPALLRRSAFLQQLEAATP